MPILMGEAIHHPTACHDASGPYRIPEGQARLTMLGNRVKKKENRNLAQPQLDLLRSAYGPRMIPRHHITVLLLAITERPWVFHRRRRPTPSST
jgi:hypothetical protein